MPLATKMDYVSVLQHDFAIHVLFNKVDLSSILLEFDVLSCLFYCCCCLWVCVGNRITEVVGFFLMHFCRHCLNWSILAVYLLCSLTNNCISVTKGIVICSMGVSGLSKQELLKISLSAKPVHCGI